MIDLYESNQVQPWRVVPPRRGSMARVARVALENVKSVIFVIMSFYLKSRKLDGGHVSPGTVIWTLSHAAHKNLWQVYNIVVHIQYLPGGIKNPQNFSF